MYREKGDAKTARLYAEKAAEILPDDMSLKKLLMELETEQ